MLFPRGVSLMQNALGNSDRINQMTMRTQTELTQIALSFVTDCRAPQSVFEFAAELEQLGAHGAAIPPMRAHQWKVIIDRLVTDGKLIDMNGCVVAPVVDGLKQMTLF